MPHFIIECNQNAGKVLDRAVLVQSVFDVAFQSGLFAKANIKSRLKIYDESLVAGEDHDFIHVWGYIREGRTDKQKRQLSEDIVGKIKELYKDAFVVSCNIEELDENSYVKIQV